MNYSREIEYSDRGMARPESVMQRAREASARMEQRKKREATEYRDRVKAKMIADAKARGIL